MMGGGTRGQQWADAIRDRLAVWGVAANPAAEVRRIMMKGQRAQREASSEMMRELIAAGFYPYNPKQEVYSAVVRQHLDGSESGEYPTARASAEAVAGDRAAKLLAKTTKKCLRIAIQENTDHPGMKRIHSITDKSNITAMASGSVSTCLGALANNHKAARRIECFEKKAAQLEAELVVVRAEAARANARLDLKDAGKDWKEAARAALAAEPELKNRELARRVGVGESTIRKYLSAIKDCPNGNAHRVRTDLKVEVVSYK